MDDNTVVSEMGEQWSPKMAPASTEAVAPSSTTWPVPPSKPTPPPRVMVSGITSGMRMAIVAHEVPVAKAIAAAVTNTRAGIIWKGMESPRSCARKAAVPISPVIAPRDHARMSTSIAVIIAFIPATAADNVSCRVRMRCASESAMATRHPASEPHSRVAYGSACPSTSISDAPGPVTALPDTYNPISTVRTTVITGRAAFHQRRGAPSTGCRRESLVSVTGIEPGRVSPSPRAARRSAVAISPRSRLV